MRHLAYTILLAVTPAFASNPPADATADDRSATISTPIDCDFGHVFTAERPDPGLETDRVFKVSGKLHGFDFRKKPVAVVLVLSLSAKADVVEAIKTKKGGEDWNAAVIGLGCTHAINGDGLFECRCSLTTNSPDNYKGRLAYLHAVLFYEREWRESFRFGGILNVRE
jgi:hypothetical protein